MLQVADLLLVGATAATDTAAIAETTNVNMVLNLVMLGLVGLLTVLIGAVGFLLKAQFHTLIERLTSIEDTLTKTNLGLKEVSTTVSERAGQQREIDELWSTVADNKARLAALETAANPQPPRRRGT